MEPSNPIVSTLSSSIFIAESIAIYAIPLLPSYTNENLVRKKIIMSIVTENSSGCLK